MPEPAARPVLAAAAAVWIAAAAGVAGTLGVAVAVAAVAAVVGRHVRSPFTALLVVLVVLGYVSGAAAASRRGATSAAELPSGPVVMVAVAESDGPRATGVVRPTHIRTPAAWAKWSGPRIGLAPAPEWLVAGEVLLIAGELRSAPGHAVGKAVAGWVRTGAELTRVGPASDPVTRLANSARNRIVSGLTTGGAGRALLAGLLVGDTSAITQEDLEALRMSGLSHYVAVSGSNVAIFLAVLWVAAGPLSWGPRRRAVIGLAGLVVFVLMTRSEPSVLRASVMAGGLLAGRLAGIPLSGWAALGTAVIGLLLAAGDLSGSVGFQLSVAATAGVMAGAGLGAGRGRWFTVLGAGLGAQVAVGPLLLLHFGELPLASPAANLLAAMPVAAATAAGGLGTLFGLQPLVAVAAALGDGVLHIARAGASLPAMSGAGAWLLLAAAMASLHSRARPLSAAVAGAAVVAALWLPGPPSQPTAVFLDVGQGDAALLLGSQGEVIIVDGGPDPDVLDDALRRYGVRRVDLVVISHQHADHVSGLAALNGLRVAEVWYPARRDEEGTLTRILEGLAAGGARLHSPGPTDRGRIGAFTIEVLGPRRRYVSPNDESLVVRVAAGDHRIVFSGDIEAVAQAELGPIAGTILKVPHQGAATTDLEWLASMSWELAVISVGSNDFGHPDPMVEQILATTARRVVRTDLHGDVRVELGN